MASAPRPEPDTSPASGTGSNGHGVADGHGPAVTGSQAVSAPSVTSPRRTDSLAGTKRDASAAASPDASSPGFAVTPEGADGSGGPGAPKKQKKKAAVPSSRGVAHLTPDQLAKKRANDREAQRAIRERTKNQIETLEKRIQDLTNQQPYQELQAVIRAKEAVEKENADIKRQLAAIVGMLRPIITSEGHEAPQASPNQAFTPSAQPPPPSAPMSMQTVSTPASTASPGSLDQSSSLTWPSSEQAKISVNNHRQSLDMGSDRLELDFLLGPSQQVSKLQIGAYGPQDTGQFQHVPMKHDWTATPSDQAFRVRQNPWAGADSQGSPTPSSPQVARATEEAHAKWAVPVKNCAATCPLDSLLLDFLNERRQRAAEGLPTQEVVGPRYPSVSSLLNPSRGAYSHPLSKVFTDILSTFPDLSSLPERVAVLYIMFLFMRWQVSPTKENYERLPEWMWPNYAQLNVSHPAWIDHLPFPAMREKLVHAPNPKEFPFDNFFIPFTTTLTLSWPYEDTDTLLSKPVPGGEEIIINPVFERHLMNLDNWKLGDAFAKAFPPLANTCNRYSKGSTGPPRSALPR